jgi:hypothetical protein
MTIPNRRLATIIGATSLVAICFVVIPPIAQDPLYHVFADGRTLHNVPNFWNVVSNVPFFIVALYGIKALHARRAFIEPWERIAFCTFLAGTAAVGVGSIYYHLRPNDARLVWDRLPMTVVFMSLVPAVIGERIGMKAGKLLLAPMILAGLGAVLYWRLSGDLRCYAMVQFGSMLAVPIVLALFPSRYSNAGRMWWVVILYALAKLAELLDHGIASVVTMGGHPWKHVAAAFAALLYVDASARRRPLQVRQVSDGEPSFSALLRRQGANQ